MTEAQISRADLHHQKRLEAVRGLDDIVEDVVNLLEEKGVLNSTYSMATSISADLTITHIFQSSIQATTATISGTTA